jgi:hypothetical protein
MRDSGLIEHTGIARDAYVAHLEKLITDEHRIAGENPEDWANESHRDAQSAWWPDGDQLDDNYYQKEIKVVDREGRLSGLAPCCGSERGFRTGTTLGLGP